MTRAFALLLVVFCLLPRTARAAEPGVRRFAIVIGNNQPDAAERETLRYADDDAAATHALLREAGVDSQLLTRLDDDSSGLLRDAAPDGPPRLEALERAVTELGHDIERARRAGSRTELLVFYSGHGDVDRGEGFVALEDGRLTRSLLHRLLVGARATTNHVFIDACKSYYMVFDRGPGGSRTRHAGPAEVVPGQMRNTGFVTSTSSDRDSHEWERYGAGILSHELRSGLRGGADADADGSISYAELGAFLTKANANIRNPRYRPDFMVHAPGDDLQRRILRWRGAGQSILAFAPRRWGHLYVEDAEGVRILDAHPAPAHALKLRVPARRPLFVVGDEGSAEYVVSAEGPLRIDVGALTARPQVQVRGAASRAFEHLFSAPFGLEDVQAFRPLDPAPREPPAVRAAPVIAWVATAAIGATAAGLAVATLVRKFELDDLKRTHASHPNLAAKAQRVRRLRTATDVTTGATAAAIGTSVWITLRW